ncbi:RING-type domain-containing protein [Mycena chlorophos]|uniref:RING-type domain-containing protein n=1 Tax=Mycena chlorophos TaxID=658473 RepID=A0A8H6TKP7_MYCCL|nr:RING-type domain-containing protein [Mycena chlorophos]
MSSRQATPGAVLSTTNSRKRALSHESDDDESDVNVETKKVKRATENTPNSRDKKKRKRKKRKTSVVAPISTSTVGTPAAARESPPPRPSSAKGKRKASSEPPARPVEDEKEAEAVDEAEIEDSSVATITRLNEELSAKTALVQKHETLLAQLTQSLTCQVCLDPLHKPYSLSPCGHIACYNCLVQWFTSEPEDQHEGMPPRPKTCPHCRARIRERPAEAWAIKDLVAGLVKSGLVEGISQGPPPAPELPGPPPEDENGPADPWHNIFRFQHQHPRFQPRLRNGEPARVEDMGMLDNEDGGVYRCLDCMHEIEDGICSSCHRVYPGHHLPDFADMFSDDDEDFDDDMLIPRWFPMPIDFEGGDFGYDMDDEDDDESHRDLDEDDGYGGSFIDDGSDVGERAADIIEIIESDDERPPRRRVQPRFIELDDEDEDDEPRLVDDHDRPSSPAPIPPVRRPLPGRSNRIVVISDSEEEDEPPIERPLHAHRRSIWSDDEQEQEDEEDGDERDGDDHYNTRGSSPDYAFRDYDDDGYEGDDIESRYHRHYDDEYSGDESN